jgi:hypothetical protein
MARRDCPRPSSRSGGKPWLRIRVVHLLHASFRRAARQYRDAMAKALMSLAQGPGPRTPVTCGKPAPNAFITSKAV